MAALRATGDETRETFVLFILVLSHSFLLFTVPNVERAFVRINIEPFKEKLVVARSLRPGTPDKEPLVKKTLFLKS